MEETIYKYPNTNLLIRNEETFSIDIEKEKEKIERFFQSYKVDIECKEVYMGPNSTTYVVDLKCKTRVSTIKRYKEDIMLNFNAVDVEFENAINGQAYLGIHIINGQNNILLLGDVIESKEFKENNLKIPIIMGKDFVNHIIVEDLTQLPHLLIAGTVGTGKSNLLSTFVLNIIYKLNPDEVKLVLIDTRLSNLVRFNKIPHLLIPTITNPNDTIGILKYLNQEMYKRYSLFSQENVDNINSYNEVSKESLPRIVVIIEDFYDLMLNTDKEIREYLQQLIQMSRASGIHIIVSTQRPSTNAITGVIKANIPARLAFNVPAQVDSKTIIDVAGAEDLRECGDALFSKLGDKRLKRLQTPYVTDEEIEKIVNEIANNNEVQYNEEIIKMIRDDELDENEEEEEDETDPLLEDAIEAVIETRMAATSFIQRRFKIGYARSGRIIDQMEARGIISGYEGSKPREVLMTKKRWNELKNGIS